VGEALPPSPPSHLPPELSEPRSPAPRQRAGPTRCVARVVRAGQTGLAEAWRGVPGVDPRLAPRRGAEGSPLPPLPLPGNKTRRVDSSESTDGGPAPRASPTRRRRNRGLAPRPGDSAELGASGLARLRPRPTPATRPAGGWLGRGGAPLSSLPRAAAVVRAPAGPARASPALLPHHRPACPRLS
jgi:hypothetical protein